MQVSDKGYNVDMTNINLLELYHDMMQPAPNVVSDESDKEQSESSAALKPKPKPKSRAKPRPRLARQRAFHKQ